jgi:hypothetical protein
VALKTTRIDGYVEAGKLTAAQATTHKANLTSRITELVNAVGGKGLGHKGMGEKMGKGLRR